MKMRSSCRTSAAFFTSELLTSLLPRSMKTTCIRGVGWTLRVEQRTCYNTSCIMQLVEWGRIHGLGVGEAPKFREKCSHRKQ